MISWPVFVISLVGILTLLGGIGYLESIAEKIQWYKAQKEAEGEAARAALAAATALEERLKTDEKEVIKIQRPDSWV